MSYPIKVIFEQIYLSHWWNLFDGKINGARSECIWDWGQRKCTPPRWWAWLHIPDLSNWSLTIRCCLVSYLDFFFFFFFFFFFGGNLPLFRGYSQYILSPADSAEKWSGGGGVIHAISDFVNIYKDLITTLQMRKLLSKWMNITISTLIWNPKSTNSFKQNGDNIGIITYTSFSWQNPCWKNGNQHSENPERNKSLYSDYVLATQNLRIPLYSNKNNSHNVIACQTLYTVKPWCNGYRHWKGTWQP